MCFDWIVEHFGRLRRGVQDESEITLSTLDLSLVLPNKNDPFAASSSGAAPGEINQLRKINDGVYEIVNLSRDCSSPTSIELVFFHGFQLRGSKELHFDTWLSADGTQLWLNWIFESFPDSRILTVSYDAHLEKTKEHGRFDMFVSTENLLHEMTSAQVGQGRCPVVLVGHSLGGVVMKELCVFAAEKVASSLADNSKSCEKFLTNVKGLFFFSTPHHGTTLADMNSKATKGLLFEELTILNLNGARRNEKFRELRQKNSWKTFGIIETLETDLGSFKGLVVPEGAARHDVDGIYTSKANHFNICRPDSRTSSSFTLLLNFIGGARQEGNARSNPKIKITDEIVGLRQRVTRVQNEVKRATRLAIVGMGGIGKTTLAKCVYNNISSQFDYTCFLKEVKRCMDKRDDPDDLRREIIKNLFHGDKRVDEKFEWNELKRSSVLIILDDVGKDSEVTVMTKEDGFSEKSRLIVISRKRGFLEREEFTFFEMEPLGDEESNQMFRFNAFKMTNVPRDYEGRIARFVKKCGGFPLALKVVGRYLYNKPKEVWDAALKRLENAKALDGETEDGLWSVLKVSYEQLQNEEREMFLDVATCYHGEIVEEVLNIWRIQNRDYDACGWRNLLDKGLVAEVPRDQVGGTHHEDILIHMHEVLRDFGRSIACPDLEHVSSHTRVGYDISDQIPTWPFGDEDNPNVKVLKIIVENGWRKTLLPIGFNEMSRMERWKDLRVLWLSGLCLYRACHLFPQELVYAKIENVPTWDDSKRNEGSSENFGNGPPSEGRLSPKLEGHRKLRYLEIVQCHSETLPISLEQLEALEELTISNCWGLKGLPDAVGRLQGLKYLTIEDCTDFTLPDTLAHLGALKHLVLRKCSSLGNLWDYLEKFQFLETLVVENYLPAVRLRTMGQLSALKYLRLDYQYYSGNYTYQDGLDNLRSLEYLDLSGMRVNGDLPNIFSGLPALKELHLSNCDVEVLAHSPGQLQALEILALQCCDNFKSLPNVGELTALKNLRIVACPSFSAIPDGLWDLQTLEELYLDTSGLTLTALPDALGNLQGLKKLMLRGNGNVKALPDTLGQLQGLKEFFMIDCGIQTLPGTIGGLGALESMQLLRCKDLKALPDALGLLRTLKLLSITDCIELTALPDTLWQLQSLETLSIVNCSHLKTLPTKLEELDYLEDLVVGGCHSLKEIPVALKQKLQTLKYSYVDPRHR